MKRTAKTRGASADVVRLRKQNRRLKAAADKYKELLRRIYTCAERWGPDGWEIALEQEFNPEGLRTD